MKKTPASHLCFVLGIFLASLVVSCTPGMNILSSVPLTPAQNDGPSAGRTDQTRTSLPSQTTTPTFTATLTQTPTLHNTSTMVPTATRTQIPTQKLVRVTPGKVTLPILLYHHIQDYSGTGDRYYVSIADFTAQMQALSDWGYQPVTVTQISNWLQNGGEMPERPVAITFDDANRDVYENAFPVLKQFHFVATMYVIGNTIGSETNFTVDMLKEISTEGWEIGSHSMTHIDLTQSNNLGYELCASRSLISKTLGVPVDSVAYPYGIVNQHVFQITKDCGFSSGAGLGIFNEHTRYSLFYLSRREVLGGVSLDTFAQLLPWSGIP
jgi:peptidoglycan/xylan/chitin deacetylase (PgdA/CDA1 family)